MPNYSNDYLGQKIKAIEADVQEIEGHIHAGERWFGLAASVSGETHLADRIGAGAATAECAVVVIDAGNDDWGTWTQILGSSDTPVHTGAKHYSFRQVHITDTETRAQRYMFQVAFQEDAPADDPGDTDVYTEHEFTSSGIAALETIPPVTIQSPHAASGTKAWMRSRAPNVNTSTMSFYFSLREHF